MEEVIFETEGQFDRSEVAAYLRRVADSLDGGDPITLRAGDQSVTLDIPSRPTFEVKAEDEGTERSVEFELEWDESTTGGESGTLEIE